MRPDAAEGELWQLHERLMAEVTATADNGLSAEPNLLDLKIALASRLLAPCRLCGRDCRVDRRVDAGFCGLRNQLELGAYAPLYNEGPLVGAPSFGVFLRGCALRCPSCYRPRERQGTGESDSPTVLASLLDAAADAGVQSWHFLGGNPEESTPHVLAALRLTRRALPVVWNTALTGSADTIRLLTGVVDVWVVDLKVATDACARAIGAFDNYARWIRDRVEELADQPFVVVRHLVAPGHMHCCTSPIRAYVRESLPGHFVYVELPLHASNASALQEPSERRVKPCPPTP